MALTSDDSIREVTGITTEEKHDIINFLQGAVYCWCKNRRDEWFSLRNLMGGENFDWNGTPLLALYHKHINNGHNSDVSIEKAGKDAGWILKKVIKNDIRNFDTAKKSLIRNYRWKK